MKKERILWIILLMLTILLVALIIMIPKVKRINKDNDNINNKNKDKNDISYWIMYKYEHYKEEEIYDKGTEANLIIKIDDREITLCTIEPERCETANYKKIKNQYITTKNDTIKNTNLEIFDGYDDEYGKIIKVIRYADMNNKSQKFVIYYCKKN